MTQQCYSPLLFIHYACFTKAAQTGDMADNVPIKQKRNIHMRTALCATYFSAPRAVIVSPSAKLQPYFMKRFFSPLCIAFWQGSRPTRPCSLAPTCHGTLNKEKITFTITFMMFCVLCVCYVGIPMEEGEDEQATSIKGRLLMLVNKIKGQAHKAEEPTKKEQAAPCEEIPAFIALFTLLLCYYTITWLKT